MKKRELSILIALGVAASLALGTGENVKAEEFNTQIVNEASESEGISEEVMNNMENIDISSEEESEDMSFEISESEASQNECEENINDAAESEEEISMDDKGTEISIDDEVSDSEPESISDSVESESFSDEEQNISICYESEDENSEVMYLSSMEYDQSQSWAGYGSITKDFNITGEKIKLIVDGETVQFERGMAAHATSALVYDLRNYKDKYSRFISYIGVDQSRSGYGNGVKFSIYTSQDNKVWTLAKDLGTLTFGSECVYVDMDISNVNYIKLYADDLWDDSNDHSVYGDAKLVTASYGGDSISSDILKTVSEYDEILNNSSIEENMAANSMTILRRDFVNKAGYESINRITAKDPGYKEAVEYLMTDETALRYFITGGDVNITGSYAASLRYFGDIYKQYEDELKNGEDENFNLRLAVSISLAYAKEDLSTFWMRSEKIRNSAKRYELYKELISSGRMDEAGNTDGGGKWSSAQFKALPVTLMKWTVDNRINDDEILWLADYALKVKDSGKDFLDAYTYIEYTDAYNYDRDTLYDPANYDKYNDKYNFGTYFDDYGTRKVYRLWMIFEEGSMCGGLAKTYSNLADVFGRPSSVVGQPGHAATITYAWNSNNKRYEWIIQNDIFGWAESGNEYTDRMLGWGVQDWSEWYSASYAILACDAVNDYDNYVKAAQLNILAESYSDPARKKEVYLKALEYQKINIDSMEGLINAYKADSSSTSTDYFNLGKRIVDTYTYYPQAMVELLGIVKDEITVGNEIAELDLLENAALVRASNATAADSSCELASKQLARTYLGSVSTELASFSFDGENAGKIVLNSKYDGSAIRIKYSLDGGTSWSETDSHVISLTEEEISSLAADNDIKIGLVGGNDIFTIDILESKVITSETIYNNDFENILVGATENLEISFDDGASWSDYVSTLEDGIRITGDKTVKVRYKANGCYLSGEPVEYTFTEDSNTPERSYLPLKNVNLVDFASQNNDTVNAAVNFIDGNYNTGWHTTFYYTEPDKFYTVSFDKVRFITDLEYTPGGPNGRIKNADVYTSFDGVNWVKSGSAVNLANNYDVKKISLDQPTACKYLKLKATETHGYIYEQNNMYFSGQMLSFFEDTTKNYEAEAVIEYSTTEETHEEVTATIILPEGCTIIGENSHVFSENGSFTFRFLNADNIEQSVEAKVDWINKDSGDTDGEDGNLENGSGDNEGTGKPGDSSGGNGSLEGGSEEAGKPGEDGGNTGQSGEGGNLQGGSSNGGQSGGSSGSTDNSQNDQNNADKPQGGTGDLENPESGLGDSGDNNGQDSGTASKPQGSSGGGSSNSQDSSNETDKQEGDDSNTTLPETYDKNQSAEGGWKQKEDKSWEYHKDGQPVKNTWISDNSWYYLNEDGITATGWNKISDSWYYFNTSGAMETGWVQEQGRWYYLKETGAMAEGWIKDNEKWYYLKESGAMATGWVKDNGNWYYLKESGAMASGWVKDNGKWYYLKESGAMATGWIKDNGKWYYLNESGAMLADTTVDGYVLGSSGAWVK